MKSQLSLSAEPDAFVWMLRAPIPRRLHEAFAAHRSGSEPNGYRVRLPARSSVAAHP